MGMKGKRG